MKKILVVLLSLISISSFAHECDKAQDVDACYAEWLQQIANAIKLRAHEPNVQCQGLTLHPFNLNLHILNPANLFDRGIFTSRVHPHEKI